MEMPWGNRIMLLLEVMDFTCQPAVVNQKLNIEPSYVRLKGERIGNRVASRSMWVYKEESGVNGASDFFSMTKAISRISSEDFDELRKLAKVKFSVVIETTMNSLECKLPCTLIGSLSRLGLDIDMDLYHFNENDIEELKRCGDC